MPDASTNATRQFNHIEGQKFIPFPLWSNFYQNKVLHHTPFGDALESGAGNLAELFRNPGGINPNLSSAIAPLFASISNQTARQTAGNMAQARGAQARSGVQNSGWAQALQAAIQNAGNRNIGQQKGQAIAQSEQLRRSDLDTLMQTFQFLTNTAAQGRNAELGKASQAASINQANQQNASNNQAAYLAAIASIARAYA